MIHCSMICYIAIGVVAVAVVAGYSGGAADALICKLCRSTSKTPHGKTCEGKLVALGGDVSKRREKRADNGLCVCVGDETKVCF